MPFPNKNSPYPKRGFPLVFSGKGRYAIGRRKNGVIRELD